MQPGQNVTGLQEHNATGGCDALFKTTLFDKGEYEARAKEIHVLIGVFTIAQVVVWTTHYAASAGMQQRVLRTFSAVLMASGAVQVVSGMYLFSAMFFWLKPTRIVDLFVYSTSDLVQMQHVTIAILNMAGGGIEILLGLGKVSLGQHSIWHVMWATCMSGVGIVFMVHPQHAAASSETHAMLGMYLVLGSFSLMAEKLQHADLVSHPPVRFSRMVMILLAGFFFLNAARLLLKYHEEPMVVHYGYTLQCHPGWAVTRALLLMGSSLLLLATYQAGCLGTCMGTWSSDPAALVCSVRQWAQRHCGFGHAAHGYNEVQMMEATALGTVTTSEASEENVHV